MTVVSSSEGRRKLSSGYSIESLIGKSTSPTPDRCSSNDRNTRDVDRQYATTSSTSEARGSTRETPILHRPKPIVARVGGSFESGIISPPRRRGKESLINHKLLDERRESCERDILYRPSLEIRGRQDDHDSAISRLSPNVHSETESQSRQSSPALSSQSSPSSFSNQALKSPPICRSSSPQHQQPIRPAHLVDPAAASGITTEPGMSLVSSTSAAAAAMATAAIMRGSLAMPLAAGWPHPSVLAAAHALPNQHPHHHQPAHLHSSIPLGSHAHNPTSSSNNPFGLSPDSPFHRVPFFHPNHPAAINMLPHHLLGGQSVSGGLPIPNAALLGLPREHPARLYPWQTGHFGMARLSGPEAGLFFHAFRKPKRHRTAFSPSQLLKLEQAFDKNHYVVGQERKGLASKLNLSETQVKVWFQNRRTKFKRTKSDDESYDNDDSSQIGGSQSIGSDGRQAHHVTKWQEETNQNEAFSPDMMCSDPESDVDMDDVADNEENDDVDIEVNS